MKYLTLFALLVTLLAGCTEFEDLEPSVFDENGPNDLFEVVQIEDVTEFPGSSYRQFIVKIEMDRTLRGATADFDKVVLRLQDSTFTQTERITRFEPTNMDMKALYTLYPGRRYCISVQVESPGKLSRLFKYECFDTN